MMNAELNKDEGVFLTVSQLAEHPRYPWLTKQVNGSPALGHSLIVPKS